MVDDRGAGRGVARQLLNDMIYVIVVVGAVESGAREQSMIGADLIIEAADEDVVSAMCRRGKEKPPGIDSIPYRQIVGNWIRPRVEEAQQRGIGADFRGIELL